MPPAREVVDFIRSHGSFLVLGHREPDGDCIASQIACARLLESLGKKATLHSAGPFDRAEIEAFAESFSSEIAAGPRNGGAEDPAVIIVDCSTPDRTGDIGGKVKGFDTLVIDHHSSGEVFGAARLVDSAAPSTTVLVLSLFDALGVSPDRDTARLLLFGLCTDTGFFRHLSLASGETFRAVARLTDLGTSTAEVFMMIYGRRELAGRRLLAEMLGRVESRWGDRFLLTWQTIEDRRRLGVTQRGEEDLYRLLQTVRGNEVVALVKEEAEGSFSVGLRSMTSLDVGEIARSFGGGGHRQASGFDISGTLASIKEELFRVFALHLSQM